MESRLSGMFDLLCTLCNLKLDSTLWSFQRLPSADLQTVNENINLDKTCIAQLNFINVKFSLNNAKNR